MKYIVVKDNNKKVIRNVVNMGIGTILTFNKEEIICSCGIVLGVINFCALIKNICKIKLKSYK